MGQRSTGSYKDVSLEDYVRRNARQLGRDVSERRVSPVQLCEMALSLAKRTEPAINAYVCFLDDYALAIARERENEARQGRIRSPLHGVSVEFASCPSFSTSGVDVSTGVGATLRREGATTAAGISASTGSGTRARWGAGWRGSTAGSSVGNARSIGAAAGGGACGAGTGLSTTD